MTFNINRIARWFVVAMLIIALLLIALLGLLLSPWGMQLTVSSANRWVTPLTVSHQQGGLLSTVVLTDIHWQTASLSAQLERLEFALELDCVWQPSLCIRKLALVKGDIQLHPTGEPPSRQESNTGPISTPVPLYLDELQIADMRLILADGSEFELRQLQLKADFAQRLTLYQLNASGIAATLVEPQSPAPAKPAADANWHYQPPELPSIQLPLDFDIKQLSLTNLSLKNGSEAAQSIDAITLVASGTGHNINLKKLSVQRGQENLDLRGEANLEMPYRLSLDATAKGQLPDQSPLNASASISGALNALTLRLKTTQPAQATANLQLNLLADNLPVRGRVQWQPVTWPLQDEPTQITSSGGDLNISGDLSAWQASLATHVSYQSYPAQQIQLKANGDMQQAQIQQLLMESSAGKAELSGSLAWHSGIEWQQQLQLTDINPKAFSENIDALISGRLNTQGRLSGDHWSLTVSELQLNGEWQQLPLQANGQLKADAKQGLDVEAFSLVNGPNQLTMQGAIAANKKANLTISVNATDVGASVPGASGSAMLDAKVSGELSAPDVQFTLSAQQLALEQLAISRLSGHGEVQWHDEKILDIQLEANDLSSQNHHIQTAKLALTGNAANHQLALLARGPNVGIEARLEGQLADNQWQGTWKQGHVDNRYLDLTLEAPFALSADWQQQRYTIGSHCWRNQDSALCIADTRFMEQQLITALDVRQLAIGPLLNRLLPELPPLSTTATLDLQAELDYPFEQQPKAQLNAQISAADWLLGEEKFVLPLQSTQVQASLAPAQWQMTLDVQSSVLGQIRAQMQLDPQSPQREIDGTITLSDLTLAPLQPLLNDIKRLGGTVNADIGVSGPIDAVQLSGTLQAQNVALGSDLLPTDISQLNTQITLKGSEADLNGDFLLGRGRGDISGTLNWLPQAAADIRIRGERLEVDYKSQLRAQVSPNLRINFQQQALSVSGDIVVPEASFRIRELPQSAVSPSSDVVIVDAEEPAANQPFDTRLDITVKVDPDQRNQVKLDAFGLTTDLQGSITLQQNQQPLQASGDLRLVNGRYKAYGQNLVIREGELLFNGPIDQPYLIFEAIRDPRVTADGVVAGLRLQGSVEQPNVEIFSEPALEQPSQLSYLLNGRDLGDSGGQDNALANLLIGLSVGRSEGVVGNLGSSLGVKNLALDTSGSGDNTQVSLSGELANGIQIRYGVGVFDSASEVKLRYELLPDLYLELISGLNNALDLYYSFSVDGSADKSAKTANSEKPE